VVRLNNLPYKLIERDDGLLQRRVTSMVKIKILLMIFTLI